MAKLKPIDFQFNAKAGAPLVFRSEVTVSDSTGEFSLTIPDEIEEVARRIARSHPMYQVEVERPRTHLRITGATLQACKNFIEHVAKDYLHCEVSEELVIVYDVNNKVTYIKDQEGRFYENGYACRDLYEKGLAKWHGTLDGSNNHSQHYQVGMIARVFKKVTYTRASGKTVVYARPETDTFQARTWLDKLNGFVGISLQSNDTTRLERMQQMPYTEEAAQFFYNTMLAMCQLADRIDNFFGNKDALMLAIERGTGLLPAPTKKDE